jgi:hypothetical protein
VKITIATAYQPLPQIMFCGICLAQSWLAAHNTRKENMNFSKASVLIALISAACLSFGDYGQVQAQTTNPSSMSGSVTQTGTAARGTPEYEQIRQFVLSHPGIKVDPSYAQNLFRNPSSYPPSITAVLAAPVNSSADLKRINLSAAITAPSPPVPLPSGTFTQGATYTITISNAGETQTWGYEYEIDSSGSGGWQLESYGIYPTSKGPNRPVGGN